MILVTGGTGLIGSHLIAQLLLKKQSVKALVRSSSRKEYFEKVLEFYHVPSSDTGQYLHWVEGDILDIPSLETAFEGVDKIYHSAATISFHKSQREAMQKVNVEGTANVVNVALHKGVRKICHVSSIAAIGRPEDKAGVIDEQLAWKSSRLNTGYAVSKHESEWEVRRGIAEGLEGVIVNPSIVLGRANPEKGSSRIFETVWNGLKFYPPGMNGFVDVEDVVNIMIELMDSNISGERYIVNGINISYLDLFTKISQIYNRKAPSIKAGRLVQALAWRAEALKSLITGRKPLITKETARTSGNIFKYSNKKVVLELDYTFKDFNTTLDDLSSYYAALFKQK
jgi:nucleoside-diphosphate-sugar epimerase